MINSCYFHPSIVVAVLDDHLELIKFYKNLTKMEWLSCFSVTKIKNLRIVFLPTLLRDCEVRFTL
jgi:hypothetical protein